MILTPKQEAGLRKALLKAFPTKLKLRAFVRQIGIELEAVALGDDLEDIVFLLVEFVVREGRLPALLEAAREEAPRKHALLELFTELDARPAAPLAPAAIRGGLPETWEFDLSMVAEMVGPRIDSREPIHFFSVACLEGLYIRNFCDRLRHRVGRPGTRQLHEIDLDHPFLEAFEFDGLCAEIDEHLRFGDVLVPVRVGHGSSLEVIFELQRRLAARYANPGGRCVIVVFFTREAGAMPGSILPIEAPRFVPPHLREWIRKAVAAMAWPDHHAQDWEARFVQKCRVPSGADPAGCPPLDVRRVYRHLERSVTLLQQHPPLAAEQFLERLEKGI